MNIAFIVGARPQYIKLSPLLNELKNKHNHWIIDTGQHYDVEMSVLLINDLKINGIKYNLGIKGTSHGEQTGRLLIETEKVLLRERPEVIIIFGDTNSTLAGALAGSKLHIPIIHIEAGLRSFNKRMPEEINRIIADHTSDFLFAPTQYAIDNLTSENLLPKSHFTGDIMVDSYNNSLYIAHSRTIQSELKINKFNYYLLTLHRPYNVDEPFILQRILGEIEKLDKVTVFPIHPRTRRIIEEHSIRISSNILMIKPLGYFDFVKLQSEAYKIITDSGGIQKEAYFAKRPCITLRSESEWKETIDAGWNLLINPQTEIDFFEKIISFKTPDKYDNIFGENVAQKMANLINKLI